MNYTVILSPLALDDLDEAFRWLDERTPQHAPEWHDSLIDALLTLEQNPQRCPLARDCLNIPGEIRQLLFGGRQHAYRILFTVHGQTVNVTHIRHGARRQLD